MSYGNLRQRTQEAAAPAEPMDRCIATGCPCRASISLEGGRWVCSAHAFAITDRWPAITESLREHDWLVGFVDEAAKLHRLGKDWRGFALQFWANQDEFCMPDPGESAEAYGLRMRAELMYRCGLNKRPAVRLPKPIVGRGNVASALQRRAA